MSDRKSRYGGKKRVWKATRPSVVGLKRARRGPYTTETKINRSTTMVAGLRSAVAPQLVTKLLYYCSVLTSGAICDDNIMSLNSLYDPEYSRTGHQPYGFDQLAALYNRYRVDRVDVDLKVLNTTSLPGNLVLLPSNDGTALGTTAVASEMPFSSVHGYASLGGPVTNIKRSYFPHIINGVTKEKYRTDDAYQSQVSTGPSEVIFLHQLNQMSDLSASAGIRLTGHYTYHCTFFDPKDLGPS